MEPWTVQLASPRRLCRSLGLRQFLQSQIRTYKISIPDTAARIPSQGFLCRFKGFVILSEQKIHIPGVADRDIVMSVDLCSQFIGLPRFVQITGHEFVIKRENEQSFMLADVIAEFVSFA